MAFMQHNRAVNGAPQPAAVDSADKGDKVSQAVLSPNFSMNDGQHRTFEPSLESLPAISSRRKSLSVDGDSKGGPNYVSNIPHGPLTGDSEDLLSV